MAHFLLVHGACAGGWVWRDLASALRERRHHVEVVGRLASAGPDAGALGNLSDDADLLRRTLDRTEGKVIVVGHSYGGMVVTEVADHPAVSHSVYLAAFWPRPGQSLTDLVGGAPLPDWFVARPDGSLHITEDLDEARAALCADLSPRSASWMLRQMVLQSAVSFQERATAPDRNHDATYLVCERDAAIPPAAQATMSAPADDVQRLHCAHMAQLSAPGHLAELLSRIPPQ